jgi:hypothetical protein
MHMTASTHSNRGIWSAFRLGFSACLALIAMVAFAALFSLPAQAQYGASLQGTVTDTTGAVVPGATVTLVDKETNRTLNASSGDTGDFTFNNLAPSLYTLTVVRDGFKKKVMDNVKILAEQANSLKVALEVGGSAETVVVNAESMPLIDTATGNIGASISQNEIAKLPSFGRDVFQLIQLAPGMFGDGAQGSGGGTSSLPGSNSGGTGSTDGVFKTENQPQSSAGGGRTDTNAISLDGVAITSVTWGGAAVITPNQDSIKEFRVVSNSYDAEFGRASGAQIQITSQNGTNDWHGTAFMKIDRPGLNAFQRWTPDNNPQRNTSRFNQMGGSVGGPILHNKLFGFFAYETIRNNSTSTGGDWFDTAAFDGLASSGSIANKFLTIDGAGAKYSKILEGASDSHLCVDIGLVQGVNCNWIEGQGLDVGKPLTSALGTQDPSYAALSSGVYTPGLGGDGTGNYDANMDGIADMFYVATVSPSTQTNQQFNGRVDFQATDKDLIAANLYYVPVDSTSFNGPARDYNYFKHSAKNYSTGLMWDHTFNGNTLNQARVDMAGWKWNELTSNPQTPYGLPDAKIYDGIKGIASFSSADFKMFGPSIGSVFDQWTLSYKDTLTKVIGSHNMKFGGQATRLAYLDEPTWNEEPTYYFNNLWDFINDAPQTESGTFDPTTGTPSSFRKDNREQLWAFFAQDDWKVRPNLTINLGLRWEYFGGMTEKAGKTPALRLGEGANTLTDISFKLGGSLVNAQKFNFGPQFGFAWSPTRDNGKLVIRGGIGIGYTGLEMALTTDTRNNPPYLASSGTLSGDQILYATADDLYTFGAFPSNPAMVTEFDSNNLPTSNVQLSVTGLPEDLPTAYTYRYSLEGQYDLGNRWVATLSYNGTTGHHLPMQYNLNNKLATKVISGEMTYNPKLSSIGWYEDSANSNFNALSAELQHQFAQSFQVDAQYRWSKAMDNSSNGYDKPDYQFLPGYNWGPSKWDVRNTIKLWGLWSPVIFRGQNNWLEKVAGGWSFSGIMNWHTGFPFNPTYSSGCAVTSTSGNCSYRPAAYLGGAGTSQSTDAFKKDNGNFSNYTVSPDAYFTMPEQVAGTAWPTDGTAPTAGALPSTPGVKRNAFFGPRYWDTDFTVTKAFGLPKMRVLGESARFEIRANAYNLFNQLNLASPQASLDDAHFGRATSVLGSRTIEMEAHFKF